MFNFINGQYAITVMIYCQADMSNSATDLQPCIEITLKSTQEHGIIHSNALSVRRGTDT